MIIVPISWGECEKSRARAGVMRRSPHQRSLSPLSSRLIPALVMSQARSFSLCPHWASFSSSVEWAQDSVLTEDGAKTWTGHVTLWLLPLPWEWRG